jgi:universal stress protein E
MNSIRHILVAVKDPAAKALPGVAKAAQLALALGADLTLFQSISVPLYLDGDISYLNQGLADAERCTQEACLRGLERIARKLRSRGIKVSVSAQFDYPVYEAVIREAARVRANLIVAEQHRGHRAASLLHLTDWELLRLSPVPVLLVKQTRAYRRPVVLAALDPDHTYAKPARLDEEILSAGSLIAGALKGTLHAIHAYVPLPVLAFPYGAISEDAVQRLQANSAQVAGRKLARELKKTRVPQARRHLVGRHPADAISQVAEKTRSSLVVMGAIARSGLKRLLIGNTAERVLDRLACDVLVVKPKQLRKHIPPKRRGARYVSFPATPVV